MEFDKVVRKRKSSNQFSGKKVSWKDVLEAIDLANQGPFAGNHNNLHFLIVEELNTIKDLANCCEQSWISNSNILIVVCSDDTHLEDLYGERGRIYSRQQAGAAIQTLLLALTDLGISSCWVGAYTDEFVKQKLKIPQHINIEAIIPVGYEKKMPGDEKKKKKELESVLYWEEWKNSRRATLFEESKEDYNPPSQ
ncbi:nitroreductase family protein [Candidatus Pacearchaeota archaeon]|nr:nitroreductase family protein [Candidatus Pacearchaeota archaeon]